MRAVLTAHVEALTSNLGEATTPEAKAQAFASIAKTVAALLWQATEVVQSSARVSALAQEEVEKISLQVRQVFAAARVSLVYQAGAGLVPVFEAEDTLRVTAGLNAENRRAGFYGDRTADDLTGVPRAPGRDPGETGFELIAKIEDWFRFEALRDTLGLIDILPVLQEPPRAREPSTLETLLAGAAQHFLGLLPGYIGGIVSEAGAVAYGALSKRDPSPFTGAPQKSLVDKHPELGSFFSTAKKVAGPAAKAAQSVSGISSDTIVSGVQVPERNDNPRGLAIAFVQHVTGGLHAYTDGLVDRLGILRSELELMPPAGLAVMRTGLSERARNVAGEIRADLIAEWASFVAAASQGGENEQGDLMRGGTLENIVDQPGVLQLAVNVTQQRGTPAGQPVVRVENIEMNGMSEAALAELRRSRRPLATVALHRVMKLSITDGWTGAEVPIGRVGFSPENHVNLDDAAWYELWRIAQGHVPDERSSSVLEEITRGASSFTRAQAESAAQMLLFLMAKTTADIP